MRLYSTAGISEHVPEGYALSVDFFNPWIEQVVGSDEWKAAEPQLSSPEAPAICESLKALARRAELSSGQKETLNVVRTAISSWPCRLAAVRSSAPEEDGAGASFAGVFETKLGVKADTLEEAVRECFASVFDHRVFSYAGPHTPSFAAVVMEMVDSYKAGVAFSANPLNSDLDEILVDSSWGLGESVVDGSVVADRFVWDKIGNALLSTQVGSKSSERLLMSSGGVEVRPVSEERQKECTLTCEQVAQLGHLVSLVESTYGRPMDTEWAYTKDGQLRLLQARPITTLFPLDPDLITNPGEPRLLYFDGNIASEATTMSPFTHMDMDLYMRAAALSMGAPGLTELPRDRHHLFFAGQTRQYLNVSAMLRLPFCTMERFAKEYAMIDPYAASIMRGDDCDAKKYRARSWPADVTLSNAWWLLRQVPVHRMYTAYSEFTRDPVGSGEKMKQLRATAKAEIKRLTTIGPVDGLLAYIERLCEAACATLNLQMGGIWSAVEAIKKLDADRTKGKTQQVREDAEAMLVGYTDDPLMQMNIAMFHLARALPVTVWDAHGDSLQELADRIGRNVAGRADDLPESFVSSWKAFMEEHGYDGTDQLFVSSPRYHERPELLLEKIRHNVGDVKNPETTAEELRRKRCQVQERQLREANCCEASKIRRRNQTLDHIAWIRNAPKLFLSELFAAIRTGTLSVEAQLLQANRLDEQGDIFHLQIKEVDQAMREPSMNLRKLLCPRKKQYFRAKQAKICPFLVDSRCRILKANVPQQEPGTLAGAAISPGVITGVVRVLKSPSETLERGEILATVLTDPAWTPLFVTCSAVILQVGGALQHGALCAREYGKPAISGIDISLLKTGMKVSVDGNTGVLKILDGHSDRVSD